VEYLDGVITELDQSPAIIEEVFTLVEGQTYVDHDLIYSYDGMLFNGSKNVDGRAFDRPENRPTNFQIPLARQR